MLYPLSYGRVRESEIRVHPRPRGSAPILAHNAQHSWSKSARHEAPRRWLQRRPDALRKLDREDRTIPIDLETVGEARIVTQALAGSQSAFEQIVRRYQRPIICLIARMTGDRALAEDLAQETFVKAFRSLAAFDTTRRLSSWLFRIAHNTAIDAMRRTRAPQGAIDASLGEGLDAVDEPATPPEPDPIERARARFRARGGARRAAARPARGDRLALRERAVVRRDRHRPRRSGGDGPIARAPRPERARAAADRVGMGPSLGGCNGNRRRP